MDPISYSTPYVFLLVVYVIIHPIIIFQDVSSFIFLLLIDVTFSLDC